MAKKSGRPKKYQESDMEQDEQSQENSSSFLRFGESYTSLLLGIIVVIISTVLLLSFVHNKNVSRNQSVTEQAQQDSKDLSKISQDSTPTGETKQTITVTPNPTVTSAVKPTAKPVMTSAPTSVPTVKPTITVASKQVAGKKGQAPAKATYTVQKGDTLWSIAEKYYKSGYNWIDISRINNLPNPDAIEYGKKLAIPSVEPRLATVVTQAPNKAPSVTQGPSMTLFGEKIASTTYKIVEGDSLWAVAVRAYGDGYKWVDIARVNNLSNPDFINPGQVMIIPRDTDKK